MVVQHILCSRMGKREVKPVVPVTPKTEPTEENTDKEESTENKDTTATDDPVKEEEGVVSETTEKEIKTEDAMEEEENEEKKDETDDVKNEDSKEQEEPPADSKLIETIVPEAKPQMIEVEEYFVKYRNFSYLHCEWRTEEEMYKGDKRIQAKLKRFKQKQQQNTNIFENVLEVYHLQTCFCIIYVTNN